MAFAIDLIGLVSVYDSGKGRRLLLLPDGRRPESTELNVPPHVASIVVLQSQLLSHPRWAFEVDARLDGIGVRSFLIDPPATISISGVEGDGKSQLDASAWDGVVPVLSDIDRRIKIVPADAATIAQIPVARGKLEAFFFADDSVAGRLTADHNDVVTITATAADGNAKTLTLLNGAEIVIANLSRSGSVRPRPTEKQDTHFRLYGQLDRNRRSAGLANEPRKDDRLQHLPSGHPYLAFIRANGGAFPSPGCSVTGGP
jgi:hypothetical protein